MRRMRCISSSRGALAPSAFALAVRTTADELQLLPPMRVLLLLLVLVLVLPPLLLLLLLLQQQQQQLSMASIACTAGDDVSVKRYKPHEHFGELALLTGKPRKATITVVGKPVRAGAVGAAQSQVRSHCRHLPLPPHPTLAPAQKPGVTLPLLVQVAARCYRLAAADFKLRVPKYIQRSLLKHAAGAYPGLAAELQIRPDGDSDSDDNMSSSDSESDSASDDPPPPVRAPGARPLSCPSGSCSSASYFFPHTLSLSFCGRGRINNAYPPPHAVACRLDISGEGKAATSRRRSPSTRSSSSNTASASAPARSMAICARAAEHTATPAKVHRPGNQLRAGGQADLNPHTGQVPARTSIRRRRRTICMP